MRSVIERIRKTITGTVFAGETYVAGGYVRDLVMGNAKSDLDIAVSLPQGGIKLAEYLHEAGIATKPVIFEQFGTALVEIHGHKIEFVMTRNESYRRGNRKPRTSPGTLLEDIIRRDFTINSLVMDIMSGEILDLTGKGLNDIKNGIIRATSDPGFIFQDDPLRILRAIRFANRLRFEIEPDTAAAMKKDAFELETISWERRRDEFEKILLSDTPERSIRLIYEFDLIRYIIPEIAEQQAGSHYRELTLLQCDIHQRLAALLQILETEKDFELIITAIIERLRFSGKIKDRVVFLVTNYWHFKNDRFWEDHRILLARLVYHEQELMDDLLLYCRAFAQSEAEKKKVDRLKKDVMQINSAIKGFDYPLNGNIIKAEFQLPESEEIGRLKELGLDIWLKNPLLGRDEIIAALKQRYVGEN